MIEAVIFDMDGLMFDTEKIYSRAWKEAATIYGVEIDDDFVNSIRGTISEKSKSMFYERYGTSFSYEEIKDKRIQISNDQIVKEGVPCKSGLYTLLNYLKDKGYKIALATSTKKETADSYLQMAQVDGFFHEKVFGDMVTNGKPEPDIFIMAADKLGVNPNNCLVLEDSTNGIYAGKSAGCKVIMIPDMTQPTPELLEILDDCLVSLDNVIDYLNKDKNDK